MEITCAGCGCVVDRGTVVEPCRTFPGCCCGDLQRVADDRAGTDTAT